MESFDKPSADDLQGEGGHIPQQARGAARRWGLHLVAGVMGLVAMAWFLIRVLPKPSRASYPCQRAAFPIATGFILWLMSFLGAGVAWAKARRYLTRARFTPAFLCLVLAGVLGLLWWQSMPESYANAAVDTTVLLPNHPLGTGRGIFPGRVTWVFDRTATTWDGVTTSTKSWWGTSAAADGDIVTSFTNQAVVNSMMSRNLQWLTGTSSDTAAWTAIFKYFNLKHSKGSVGYTAGEKIFIKTNWVTYQSSEGGNGVMSSSRQYFATSPEIVIALLTQLKAAGVNLSSVTMGDTVRDWPQHVYNRIHNAFPSDAINFVGVDDLRVTGTSPYYQTKVARSTDPLYFSNHPTGVSQDYIPTCFENAAYAINLAQMKTHARNGVTLCGKNYFGAMGRNPNASGYFNTHKGVLVNPDGGSDSYGQYRVLVDLSGHPKLGGNVLLWIMDALYSGYDWSAISPPVSWVSAPFNNDNSATFHWPSSILMSMDPVAIDSVCLDLWKNEKWAADAASHPLPGLSINCDPTRVGVEDYLMEMAKADAPFSGTVYKPDGTHVLSSLGTYEHWNPALRKYTRNLGTGFGIDLVTAQPTVQGRWIFYNNSAWDGNSAAANANDDLAIAPDKMPLLPGGTASFINYTSYSRGMNGVMVDVAGVPSGLDPVAGDFVFMVGNSNSPGTWKAAPVTATVAIRRGQGYNGSDRITIIWADNAIKGQWLQVHMLANVAKNLPEDVFYVGNAPGDTGNSATLTNVDTSDELRCRNDPHGPSNLASIINNQDFNRDQIVNSTDEQIARDNATNFSTALKLIAAP